MTITVLEDDIVEGTEVFTLSLESSDDVVIAPEEAQVEILDATQGAAACVPQLDRALN